MRREQVRAFLGGLVLLLIAALVVAGAAALAVWGFCWILWLTG